MKEISLPSAWIVFILPDSTEETTQSADEKEYGVLTGRAMHRVKETLGVPDPFLEGGIPTTVPEFLMLRGVKVFPHKVKSTNGQADLRPFLGSPPFARGNWQTPDDSACGRVAYVFIPFESPADGKAVFGFGADLALQAWLNGKPLGSWMDRKLSFPPTVHDRSCEANIKEGTNLLFLRFVSGKGSSVLAVGGPGDLATFDRHSILNDAILAGEENWVLPELRVSGTERDPVRIDDRRELFVDDALLDGMSGGASLRLHHPQEREVVFSFDAPWEGNCNGCFQPVSIFRHEDRIWMYYKGANRAKGDEAWRLNYSTRSRSGHRPEITCLAFSRDGVHFERPELGLIAIDGCKNNNVVWDGPQYFTPFVDTKPGVPGDQRFKAITRHREKGLGAYGSSDGLRWRLLAERPVVTKGTFDSQNVAFWDSAAGCYREYHRGNESSGPYRGVRGIMTSQSSDFLHWSEPEALEYTDELPMHLYTNCIRPYERAPHLLIGTPGRFVGSRTKLPDHGDFGVCDSILIAGRDGKHFKRWGEAFIRPSLDPLNWADRNNFTAWGMIQTSPEELSLYWCEHNGFSTLRLRRGVIRTDGFVSLHAGCEVGELLTVPVLFAGHRLVFNYATSATGTLRVELCGEDGCALPGFTMAESELIFGNALEHEVSWGGKADVSTLAGKPVRLRIRLQDADLYSFRFR